MIEAVKTIPIHATVHRAFSHSLISPTMPIQACNGCHHDYSEVRVSAEQLLNDSSCTDLLEWRIVNLSQSFWPANTAGLLIARRMPRGLRRGWCINGTDHIGEVVIEPGEDATCLGSHSFRVLGHRIPAMATEGRVKKGTASPLQADAIGRATPGRSGNRTTSGEAAVRLHQLASRMLGQIDALMDAESRAVFTEATGCAMDPLLAALGGLDPSKVLQLFSSVEKLVSIEPPRLAERLARAGLHALRTLVGRRGLEARRARMRQELRITQVLAAAWDRDGHVVLTPFDHESADDRAELTQLLRFVAAEPQLAAPRFQEVQHMHKVRHEPP